MKPCLGIHSLRVISRLNLPGFPLTLSAGRRELLFACLRLVTVCQHKKLACRFILPAIL